MSVQIIITNSGRAALVNAQNTGTLPVVITQVGLSQSALSPAAAATSLPGEFKRISGVAGDAVAPDTIHINMSDTSSDAYSLRSFALYLADGTLFGIYGQSAPILEKVAASDALLAIDVVFGDIAAASLTFGNTNFLNPPATTERQGVVELATVSEAQAGIDALRALTPASAKAAILGWLLSQDGSGSGLDADMLDGMHASAFAQLTGAVFTGPLARDSQFRLDMSGGIPMLIFGDDGSGTDRLEFDRASNSWVFNQAGNERLRISTTELRANGVVVWTANNDGAGSGLDADLFDGLDSSYYVNIPARLGYTPLNQASYTAADVLSKLVTVDGAGSGLDADLFDGLDSSQFNRITQSNLTENGYRIHSDGFKEAWGYVDVGANSSAMVSLPEIFTSWVNPRAGAYSRNTPSAQENSGIYSILGLSGFSVFNWEEIPMRLHWHAIGV